MEKVYYSQVMWLKYILVMIALTQRKSPLVEKEDCSLKQLPIICWTSE